MIQLIYATIRYSLPIYEVVVIRRHATSNGNSDVHDGLRFSARTSQTAVKIPERAN